MVDGTRIFDNGMTLSELASQISQIQQGEQEAYVDIKMFGAPSECGASVRQAVQRELSAALEAAGVTAEQFVELVCERTTPRFAHFSGLSGIVMTVSVEIHFC